MRKFWILGLLITICGCGNKKQEARINQLEARLDKLTRLIEARDEPSERKDPPILARNSIRSQIAPELPQIVEPHVLSVVGRVTEANSTWWRWSYVITVENTNSSPAQFDIWGCNFSTRTDSSWMKAAPTICP